MVMVRFGVMAPRLTRRQLLKAFAVMPVVAAFGMAPTPEPPPVVIRHRKAGATVSYTTHTRPKLGRRVTIEMHGAVVFSGTVSQVAATTGAYQVTVTDYQVIEETVHHHRSL